MFEIFIRLIWTLMVVSLGYRVYSKTIRNRRCTEEVEAKIIETWYRRKDIFENKRVLCEYEYGFNTYKTTIVLRSTLNSIIYNKGDYLTLHIDPRRPERAIRRGAESTSAYISSIGIFVISVIIWFVAIIAPIFGGLFGAQLGIARINKMNSLVNSNGGNMVYNMYNHNDTDTYEPEEKVTPIPECYQSLNGASYTLPDSMEKKIGSKSVLYVDKETSGKKEYMYVYVKEHNNTQEQAILDLIKSFKLDKYKVHKKVSANYRTFYIYIVPNGKGVKEYVVISASEYRKVAIRYLYSKENAQHVLDVINSMEYN